MKTWLERCFLNLIYGFLYLPILVLIVLSVNQSRFSMRWHGFSLQWYAELLHDQALWTSFFHSLCLGLTAAGITTTLGCLTCVHLFLYPSAQKRVLNSLLLILIIIPDLILGVALLIFCNWIGLPTGFFSLLIAHVTFCLPFVVLTIKARIRTLDPNLYDSALDLGASPQLAMRKVLLPLLWPGILSAYLLCFTLSFDDVVISYFVTGPDYNLLSLAIYGLVRSGVTPELNALCSITFFISMLLVIVSHRLMSRQTNLRSIS